MSGRFGTIWCQTRTSSDPRVTQLSGALSRIFPRATAPHPRSVQRKSPFARGAAFVRAKARFWRLSPRFPSTRSASNSDGEPANPARLSSSPAHRAASSNESSAGTLRACGVRSSPTRRSRAREAPRRCAAGRLPLWDKPRGSMNAQTEGAFVGQSRPEPLWVLVSSGAASFLSSGAA